MRYRKLGNTGLIISVALGMMQFGGKIHAEEGGAGSWVFAGGFCPEILDSDRA
jgi:aryl-alcohol dehydrogenase-like predicted oxidoreductase